jgi:hypothetical protein
VALLSGVPAVSPLTEDGAGEFSGETTYDSHCVLSSAVCTFSSGDGGNPGGYPAYNP